MTEKVINIGVQNKTLLRKVNVVQGDSGRALRCVVSDYTLPDGVTARIYAKKPSGMEVYNACTIDGNAVISELTTGLLSETGEIDCQIELSVDGDRVTSFYFVINVEKSLISDSSIESTDEFGALQTLINDTEAATKAANEAATKAVDTAERAAAEAVDIAEKALSEQTVTFAAASSAEELKSGETVATLFGKVKKWLTDLKSNIGTLSSLTTAAKTSLVAAVNELVSSVSDLDTNKSNAIAVSDFSIDNQSIAANAQSWIRITCTKDGYTLLGCLGVHTENGSTSGVGGSNCVYQTWRKVSDTQLQVAVKNIGSSAANVKITVRGLFVKS